MKKFITFMAVVIVVIIAVLWYLDKGWDKSTDAPSPSPSVSATATAVPTQSVSDGTIKFTYGSDYGLATTPAQVLVTSYIPSCDPGFNYCLYYDGSAYKGTNFDSAGLRVQKRADLKTQSACLSTMPSGFAGIVPVTANGPDYATSVFSPLGDAGAGHYASGAEYRLWYVNSCYEFETRIGQTQFANYPAGSIQQFTDADNANVQAGLMSMLDSITLSNNEQVSFPAPKATPAN